MDQGTSFVSKEIWNFVEIYMIKLLNSSLYYSQANGQAKSSNDILIKLIKKVEDNLKRWHVFYLNYIYIYTHKQIYVHVSSSINAYCATNISLKLA
jgi:hypothetical protein